MQLLANDFGGFPIDRLTHCTQTATWALQNGEDEEYVVCALLHDIGDTLGSYNHPEAAAVILQPFVSEANYWMAGSRRSRSGSFRRARRPSGWRR